MNRMDDLFIEHERTLVIFSASITKNSEDAKEVVQEVFLECLEKKIEVNRPYLFQSVRNRSLNRVRFKGRLLNFIEKFQEYWNNILPIEFLSNDYNVWELLSTLPHKQREVLLLRIKGELKIGEIAGILSIPEGTVKSRINKALATLRKKYRGEVL